MWNPIFKGDFKKLIRKKIKIVHGSNHAYKDQYESEGELLDIFIENQINEITILIKVIKNIKKYGTGYIFISQYRFLPIKSSQITSVNIESYEIKDLIKQMSIKSLCLDIAYIILDFLDIYIPL